MRPQVEGLILVLYWQIMRSGEGQAVAMLITRRDLNPMAWSCITISFARTEVPPHNLQAAQVVFRPASADAGHDTSPATGKLSGCETLKVRIPRALASVRCSTLSAEAITSEDHAATSKPRDAH